MIFRISTPALSRLVSFLLLSVAVVAADAGDFYRADVPAPAGDQDVQRQRALAAALQIVVRQVTGDTEAAASSVLTPEYENAGRYAKEYRFVDSPAGQRLDAIFDPAAVDAMLQGYGLSPRAHRPSALVWMAGADPGGDRLLLAESDADAWEAVARFATRGGIEMFRPLMDLEDQMRLPPADISARVPTTLRDASARYSPDAAVSAYLAGDAGGWQADWLLLSGDTIRRWSTRGRDPFVVLEAGMNDVAGILATLFPLSPRMPLDLSLPAGAASIPATGQVAPVPGPAPAPAPLSSPAGQILVRVAGIGGAGDYGRVMSVFRNNPAVAEYRVVASEPDAVIFSVALQGNGQAVAQALEAEDLLTRETGDAAAEVHQGVAISFRLNR